MDPTEGASTNKRKGKAGERLSISEIQVHGHKRRRMSTSDSSTGIFPIDVWHIIAGFIPAQDTQRLSVLARVSKTLYENLIPRLYRDLIVAAPSSRNFLGCIKTIDRHLSRSQSGSLIQNLSALVPDASPSPAIPNDIDPTLVPHYVRYVKRLLVGWSKLDPERAAIVTEDLQQAIGNLTGLEVVVWLDNHIKFTDAIGRHLASLNLKAFVFNFSCLRDPSSLSGIKNLAYLDIFRTHDGSGIRDLLSGSKDTLRTLIYEEGAIPVETGPDSLKDLLHDSEAIKLPSLTTLCLKINRLDRPDASCLLTNIDFTRLTYFEFSTCKHSTVEGLFSHQALFEALFEKYGPDSQSGRLKLKTFRFRSRLPVRPDKYFLGLLSSFDTLQAFVFEEIDNNEEETEEGDIDGLLSALSGHKNLELLSIHAPPSTEKRWQFSREHFTKTADYFPKLKHLACSYVTLKKPYPLPIRHTSTSATIYDGNDEEIQEEPTLSVLPNLPNLRSYTIPGTLQTTAWISASAEAQIGILVAEVLPEFLRQMRMPSTEMKKSQRWEDRYKLSVLTLGRVSFKVGSEPLSRHRREQYPASVPRVYPDYDSNTKSAASDALYVRQIPPEDMYNGYFPVVNFLRVAEWRARNYNGTKGDWFQGIKL
ncbi:hypothetical protein TWF718_010767 [Orbilia javanica]|uniref:F-box domain-containing protein n=1 Tax=Orbilia javanica TaxID=47235 RepID=A0AAN8RCU6_9PEZI